MAQTRRRRTTKKTTKRKSARRKSQASDHTLNWVGVGFLVVGLLALFRLGLIGNFFANCLRLVVGNSFLFLAVLVAAYGLWLLISGKVLYLKRRLVVGGGLAYLGALIFWSGQLMARLSVHSHYILANWRLLASDFRSMTTATDVGGGMLGGIGFGALAPLVSGIGAQVVAVLLVIIGILVLCGVTMVQVFSVCQAIGRGLAKLFHRLQAAFADMTAAHAEKAAQAASEKPQEKPQTQEKPKPAAADDFTINAPQAATEPAPKPKPAENAPEPKTEDADAADDSEDLDSGDPAADYQLPSPDILTPAPPTDQTVEYNLIKTNRVKLKETFDSFGVDVTVKAATLGPTVTQYEIQPAVGVKVAKIVNLSNDLALALAAKDIRIEAPIPGKSLIGIEVPNTHVATVGYQEVLEKTPPHPGKPLVIPLGKDVAGNVKTMDLAKMPHLLIAGATGSGKSVMINVIITSILMTAKPTDVRLMLIDPKRVELSVYNGVPHLLTPVITEAKKAPAALNKVLAEMDRRYERFSAAGVRNMGEYNRKVADSSDPSMKKMPYIVMIVDELSDLMMVAGKEVETAIVRLAQMARAAGIHIIIATQRPSVDVITGLIKANIPSRIAFAVSSGVDSRTILDSNGAEKLLGRGDMLYQPVDASKPVRIQGAYIPSEDVEAVVSAITSQVAPAYVPDMAPTETDDVEKQGDSEDELYEDAKAFVIQQQSASTSMLQRRFRIGYNRAARLIDDLEANQVVGPSEGSKPRKVFIAPDSTDAQ